MLEEKRWSERYVYRLFQVRLELALYRLEVLDLVLC